MAEQTVPELLKFHPMPITFAIDAYEVIDTDAFRACMTIVVNAMAGAQMMVMLLRSRLDRMNKLLGVLSITNCGLAIELAQIAEIIRSIGQELASLVDAFIVGFSRVSARPEQ